MFDVAVLVLTLRVDGLPWLDLPLRLVHPREPSLAIRSQQARGCHLDPGQMARQW